MKFTVFLGLGISLLLVMPFLSGSALADGRSANVFTPPSLDQIPEGPFGEMVRKGHLIFTETDVYAKEYVGNGLKCVNCHLGHGMLPHSAPMWAAIGQYPAYRKKNGKVNTFAERIQGCFLFSMNGKEPPAESEVIRALTTYSYWMGKGAPLGVELMGRGYPELPPPTRKPTKEAGEKVYQQFCHYCHGMDGKGKMLHGRHVFPPLWGPNSYNWGAGMHQINVSAAFIKQNMPFGQSGILSDQDAWDVATFINSQPRPQDPRLLQEKVKEKIKGKGSFGEFKKRHHNHDCLYDHSLVPPSGQ